MFIADVLIPEFHGLAVIAVSVLALSMFELTVPGAQVDAALCARLLDTAIGAALVVVLRLVLWPRATAQPLPQVQARTVRAAAEVFRYRCLGDDQTRLARAKSRLRDTVARLTAITADAPDDDITARRAWPGQVALAVDEVGMLARGLPFSGRRRRPMPRQRWAPG